MKKVLVSLLVVAFVVAIAAPAFAMTDAQLKAVLKAAGISDAQITALLAGSSAGSSDVAPFTKNLALGSRGADVTRLQQFLYDGEYLAVEPTGYFGAKTKKAVADYQKAAGITPASGNFGPLTRAAVNDELASAPVTTTPGTTPVVSNPSEGTYTLKVSAAVVSDTNATAGADKGVYALSVKSQSSDITIDRVDLQTKVTLTNASGAEYHPATFISAVSAYDGSTKLMTKSLSMSDWTKDSAGVYYLRLTGLGFKIPKDTTKDLVFKFDLNSAIDTNRYLTVGIYGTQGVRGVDTMNISTYSYISDTRTFTFKKGGSSTVTASLDANTPAATSVKVDTSNGVKDVPMMNIFLKATVGDATVQKVQVNVSTTSASAISLWDGSTKVGSLAAGGAYVLFTDLGIKVPQDTSKVLTVKMDMPALTSGAASTSLAANGVSWDSTDGSVASSSNSSAIVGNDMNFKSGKAATYTLTGTPSVSAGTVNMKLFHNVTFPMKVTVDGDSLSEPVAGNFAVWVSSSTPGSANDLFIGTPAAPTLSPDNTSDLISDGGSTNVNLSFSVGTSTWGSGATLNGSLNYVYYIKGIGTKFTGDSTLSTTTVGLSAFKTPSINLVF